MAVFIFIWKFHIAWFFKTVVIAIISFTLFFKEESSGQLFPDLPGPSLCALAYAAADVAERRIPLKEYYALLL